MSDLANTRQAFEDGQVVVDLHRLTGDLSERSCLSQAEQTRATAFRFDRDRHRYMECHGRLRHQVGALLAQPPDAIPLETGPFGKPFVAEFPMHFNLSHAGDYYAAAFCRDHEVGIDVEVLPEPSKLNGLVQHICHPAEGIRLNSLSSLTEREDRLLFYWTAKEALLKALGVGLQIEPDFIEVVGAPADGTGTFASTVPEARADEWQWHLLTHTSQCKLTVVVPRLPDSRILFPGFAKAS